MESKADWVDWFNLIAKERGLANGWCWFASKVHGERPHHVFIVSGGVPGAVFKSGKNKGKLNPAKRAHVSDIAITEADLIAIKAKWAADTGKCADCYGSGLVTVGWSKDGGVKKHKCKACGGAGLATKGEG